MTTYSLAITGVSADSHPSQPATLILPDAMVPTAGVTISTATVGGRQAARSQNTPLLCQGPDGSLKWYTLESDRSPGSSHILKAV